MATESRANIVAPIPNATEMVAPILVLLVMFLARLEIFPIFSVPVDAEKAVDVANIF